MKIQLIIFAFAATAFAVALTGFTPNGRYASTEKVTQDTTFNWKKLTHEERVQYMRTEVLPKMRQLFASFDPVKYERINCKTCHGDGATNESFEMPNPKLPKLPETAAGFQELMQKDSAIMSFMMHTVKPQMAQLLGLSPYDPKNNPEGFGCHNCHTTKK